MVRGPVLKRHVIRVCAEYEGEQNERARAKCFCMPLNVCANGESCADKATTSHSLKQHNSYAGRGHNTRAPLTF